VRYFYETLCYQRQDWQVVPGVQKKGCGQKKIVTRANNTNRQFPVRNIFRFGAGVCFIPQC